jgi:hypothetical protein
VSDVDEAEIDGEAGDGERRAGGSRRLWKWLAAIAVIAAAGSVGVLGWLLLNPGQTKVASNVMACIPNHDFTKNAKHTCPPSDAQHVDGLVENVTDTTLDVVTIDGKRYSYEVRPADLPYLDIPHAQQHAALGQPMTVYTKKAGGDTVIVYMRDSTINFQKAA